MLLQVQFRDAVSQTAQTGFESESDMFRILGLLRFIDSKFITLFLANEVISLLWRYNLSEGTANWKIHQRVKRSAMDMRRKCASPGRGKNPRVWTELSRLTAIQAETSPTTSQLTLLKFCYIHMRYLSSCFTVWPPPPPPQYSNITNNIIILSG